MAAIDFCGRGAIIDFHPNFGLCLLLALKQYGHISGNAT